METNHSHGSNSSSGSNRSVTQRSSTPPPPAGSLLRGRRFRLLRVYRVTAQVLLSYGLFNLVGFVRGRRWRERHLPRVNQRNARRIQRTIAAVQGLFIKVGQLISILSNFLPEDFRQELEALQDHIPPRPAAEIERRLREELGAGPDELFADFGNEPVASASLAQVHAARLADGTRVAVKVQHLDIEAMAHLDLNTIRRVLAIVGFVLRIKGLGSIYSEVREMILEELDFTREAEHIEAIGAGFRDDPKVSCPQVIANRSSQRVLTTRFVDGVKVTDLAALAERGIDRAKLAERILEAYCRMIFTDELYHADPHPGNILVRDDGAIVFVDFGAVARLSPRMKEGIPQFLEGLLSRDEEKIGAAIRRLGFIQRNDDEGVARRVIDYFYSRFLDDLEIDSWNLADIHVDAKTKLEMMLDLRQLDLSISELTATFQVPKDWILFFRTLLLLTGVCTHLDPQMNPITTIRPYVETFVLGRDRDWLGLFSSVVKDMALSAVTLPDDLKRFLTRANRGDLEVEMGGLRPGFVLLYSLGHQLICTLLALGAGFIAYSARSSGDEALTALAAGTSGFFLLCLGSSLLRARKLRRKIYRR
ncbi:MAG: AarF/UbiB family protein [Acidobacteriota bacterium]